VFLEPDDVSKLEGLFTNEVVSHFSRDGVAFDLCDRDPEAFVVMADLDTLADGQGIQVFLSRGFESCGVFLVHCLGIDELEHGFLHHCWRYIITEIRWSQEDLSCFCGGAGGGL